VADKTMKFVLDFAAKTAGLRDATAMADELGDELNADVTAGKAMAAALKAAADTAERALADTVEIADKLGDALGTEMRQAIGQSKIDEMAVKFQQAGLQASDLDGNLDSITDSIKRMDAASGSAKGRLGEVGQAMNRVGGETERSRSVMANFAGNAAQELPGMTGAFGPLNMAIGQFAEYATEGNISLKNMAASAGPMLGVGAAIVYANKQFDLMKKKDAFNTDRVKAFEEIIRDGTDAVGDLAEHLRKLGKIETDTSMNALNPMADATRDVTDELMRAGLTVEDYARLVTGSREDVKAWGDAMRESGADGRLMADVLMVLATDHERYAEAAENARKSAKFFAEDMAPNERAARDFEQSLKDTEKAYLSLTGALDSEQALVDVEQDLLNLTDALADIDQQFANGEITQQEWRLATRDAILGAQSSVADYAEEIAKLPPEVTTKLLADVEAGNIQQVIALLEKYRRLSYDVTDVRGERYGTPRYAAGTRSAAAGMALVGENGPELVNFRGGESVLPSGPTRAALGGGDTYNITVQTLKADADIGRVIQDALNALNRRGG